MARWLACAVVAAFIFGNGARAEDATGRERYWANAEVLGWKIVPPMLKPIWSLIVPFAQSGLTRFFALWFWIASRSVH